MKLNLTALSAALGEPGKAQSFFADVSDTQR